MVDVNSDPTFPQLPTEEDLGKIGICYTYLGFWEGRGARTIFFSKKPGMKTEGPTFSLDWRDAYGWWWMLSENHSQHMDIYIYIHTYSVYTINRCITICVFIYIYLYMFFSTLSDIQIVSHPFRILWFKKWRNKSPFAVRLPQELASLPPAVWEAYYAGPVNIEIFSFKFLETKPTQLKDVRLENHWLLNVFFFSILNRMWLWV